MVREQHEVTSNDMPFRHFVTSMRYTYTEDQLEVLEMVYSECPRPSCSLRQQLVSVFPVLADLEPKQIRIWFQNRRSREKRNEASIFHTVNRNIAYVNEILTGENDRLQNQETSDNGSSFGTVITSSSLRNIDNPAGLFAIAEETLRMFLSKATGTAIDWVEIPGMKPGEDSVGVFGSAERGTGIAARACGFVNLDVKKIAKILKDRARWFQDCRKIKVFSTTCTDNGGIIELVYTQTYAPTTLAQARDFWTLRYTTTLENRSVLVCERSLVGSGAGPDLDTSEFVRGEMLPSGYLITPCEGGGSIIHIVDHINVEAGNVLEVLQPLYESSEVVARRMTIAALRYLRQIAQEATEDVIYTPYEEPTLLRTYSQKLNRGFNDAINGFSDDGWSQFGSDATDDVRITIKSTETIASSSSDHSLGDVLCAKASMLLKNVSPAEMIGFMRNHRSEWVDFSVESYCAASMKVSCYPPPEMMNRRFSTKQVIMPLGDLIEHEQVLEVIRLRSLPVEKEDACSFDSVNFLQMVSSTDETSMGAYSELVFSPTENVDDPVLPSGFRVIPLNVKSNPSPTHRVGAENAASTYAGRAIMTIAFQFPIGDNLPEHVASMAHKYVRSVISTVYKFSVAFTPFPLFLDYLLSPFPGYYDAETLAQWIWQSYCYHVDGELFRDDKYCRDLILKNLWNHEEAILCCSLKQSQPQFIFANHAGLDLLETTLVSLQNISVDKVISNSALNTLIAEFPKIMYQGFSYLPDRICTSTWGRQVLYDEAIAWKVLPGEDVGVDCFAIAFVNWSFA